MSAPENNVMARPTELESVNGVVVRQVAQKLEAVAQTIGLPYEAKNQYKLSLLPEGKNVATSPSDDMKWKPTADDLLKLDSFLFVKEESSTALRICLAVTGCLKLRPLKMHFSVDPESGDAYLIERPFKLGGFCCCPLTMDMHEVNGSQKTRIGRVKENYDCWLQKCLLASCCCKVYHDVERVVTGTDELERAFQVQASLCCFGRVNNCCGGTCCKNDQVFDIMDADGEEVVAHIQKTYAPGSGACCRCMYMFSNYVLEFPPGSSVEDRLLLITSIFQLDYQIFEKDGG